ncbi:MAG: DNA ligase, partial [Desulfurococcus sp.]
MSIGQADIPVRLIADVFERIEVITSRIQMTALLVTLFKQTPPEIIDRVVYLIQGRLWPDWKELPELGVGEKLLVKAIALATNSSEAQVEDLAKSLGDLGKVAEQLKSRISGRQQGVTLFSFTQQQPELTVNKVYDTLVRVAMAQGEGSKDLKIRLLAGLLREASPKEAKFIVRFVEGRLRVGIGEATVM